MTEILAPSGRTLSDAERSAFQRLGLSPGNWAALVAAPFFHRPGICPPNLQKRTDGLHLEGLRRELRTASGLSEQTGQFWKRLGASATADLAETGTRLLAWYLATEIGFVKRQQMLRLTAKTAGEFALGTHPRAVQLLDEDMRFLVDSYLPCGAFSADAAPLWNPVPEPSVALLDALAGVVGSPTVTWPAVALEQLPAQFPGLIRLLGEPVGEWWGRASPGRRAVERGTAALSFTERERVYGELAVEWRRAADDEGAAGAFVDHVREWVDAVRKSVRATAKADPSVPKAPVAKSSVVLALAPRVVPDLPNCPVMLALRSVTTGRELRLEDGMRVGRADYREVLGEAAAGLAAADQFELVRDGARGVWLVRAIGAPRFPTCYQGEEVGPEGCDIAADGIISVGGRLELLVRFE
jgi:hypothetical protein